MAACPHCDVTVLEPSSERCPHCGRSLARDAATLPVAMVVVDRAHQRPVVVGGAPLVTSAHHARFALAKDSPELPSVLALHLERPGPPVGFYVASAISLPWSRRTPG